jgi:hypothetical protein
MTTYTLTGLYDKRVELAWQILETEKQARQLRDDLAHVEATIRILRPGAELPKVVPRRVEFRPRYFKRGALTRLCLDYLRDHAGQPMVAVSDILPLAIGERDLTARDQEILRVTIHQAMHKLAKRGIIERLPAEGRIVHWRLAGEA